ncbi:MAG TPA: cyclic nucleotide-binding domain-containing protein [Candidatus Limnocylindria bacterium]|nr:cyclic nucleotide-binding domain-containing protein [Candidatus Limnocylindria bacterium]
MVRDEKLEKLRQVPLFAHLGKRETERLSMLADELDVPDGQVLTRQGGSGGEFFIVLDGQVAIEKDDQRIATMHPGDFLGEIALIDGKPRTATARAEGDARLLVVGRGPFHELMEEFPSVRISVLQALAERVRAHEPENA